MMWVLMFLFLFTGFIWSSIESKKRNKRKAQVLADFRNPRMGWEIYIADTLINPTLLAVDAVTKQITVGTLDGYADIAWADICRVEVESNNTSLTTTNRGSQLLGGVVGNVLLGPMGLLIGGLTGSSSTRQRVNDLTLKIIVEHPTRPMHRVLFFRKGGKGVKPNAWRLRQPAERLDHFHALLLNAMRAAERERTIAAPAAAMPAIAAPTISDTNFEQRLAQLWDLHQSGALTREEFSDRKQRLLGGS